MRTSATPRARRKWVAHGLSNALVYGGLSYGARRLPLAVLRAISLFVNAIAIVLMRRTRAELADNFRRALGVSHPEAARLARAQFYEYGRATVDLWRGRAGVAAPRPTTFDADAQILGCSRRAGRGFLLVTGHAGNWEMGAATLRGHGLGVAVVGQPELDPRVHALRLAVRQRLGVESIDIGASMATAFRVRSAIDRGLAVALLVDRAYPEDEIVVPFFGHPTPFLRSPALLARFCDCDVLPGFLLRDSDGTYRNVFAPAIGPDPSASADDDARRIMTAVAAALEAVIRQAPAQWFNFYRFWK